MLRSPLLALLVSVVLYFSGNSAGIAAGVQTLSTFLAAVTEAQARLPAPGTVPGLAGDPSASAGFPGLIIAVVIGCFFLFYLAHRRKP